MLAALAVCVGLILGTACRPPAPKVTDGLINCAKGDLNERAADLASVALAILTSPSDWLRAIESWARDTGEEVAACAIRLATEQVKPQVGPDGEGAAAESEEEALVMLRAGELAEKRGWRFAP